MCGIDWNALMAVQGQEYELRRGNAVHIHPGRGEGGDLVENAQDEVEHARHNNDEMSKDAGAKEIY